MKCLSMAESRHSHASILHWSLHPRKESWGGGGASVVTVSQKGIMGWGGASVATLRRSSSWESPHPTRELQSRQPVNPEL